MPTSRTWSQQRCDRGATRVVTEYLTPPQTNLPIFSTPTPSSRRRFQDFVFLRDHLSKDFPACVVPALPDKHRLGPSSLLFL
jgi:hypothetical protein